MADPTGFNDYIVNFLQPEHDWKLDESGTPIEDYGTATDSDLNIGGSGNTYQQTGDVTYETDYAIKFDGTSNARLYDSQQVPDILFSQGSVMSVFTVDADDAAADVMFGVGDGGTGSAMIFRHQAGSGNDYLSMYITNSGNCYRRSSTSYPILGDGKFHMAIWVQPNDGTGMRIYLDGVLMTLDTDNDVLESGYDLNSWFADNPTKGRNVIASHPATGNNTYEGSISRVFVTDEVLTQTQITNLQTLRTNNNLITGSNQRRQGRKYFSLGAS